MPGTSATSKGNTFSIVFTSFTMDRFKDICELLTSIKAQTYPHLETVFVADQSAELAARVEEYAESASLPVTVLLNQKEAGVNVCRNIGIRAAQGEIVALVDDDVVLFPDWAQAMVESYTRDPAVVAVTGPAIPLWEDKRMSWFPREFYWMWGSTVWEWEEVRQIRNVGGMNCSYKRGALHQVGLYRPGLGPLGGDEKTRWFHPSGEEVELSLRIRKLLKGAKIIYDPRVKVYHKVQKSRFVWPFMIKRAFRMGYYKHFVEELFHHDFQNEPILDLERDHLWHILFRLPLSLLKELPSSPRTVWRKSLVALAATLFTGLGYLAYFLRPVRETDET